jgi:hypothetical protein
MTIVFKCIALSLVLIGTAANAQVLTNAQIKAAWKSPNPMASVFTRLTACQLVTPIQSEVDGIGAPTRNGRGSIVHLERRTSPVLNLDLPKSFPFCAPRKWKPRFAIPENPKFDVAFDMSYKNEASLSAALKATQILNVLDAQLRYLDAARFGFEVLSTELDDGDLQDVGQDFAQNYSRCRAWNSPNGYVISKVCVGNMFVAMDAQQGLSLKALDLTFSTLTVGIKADWVRQIKGELDSCPEAQKKNLDAEKENAKKQAAEKKKLLDAAQKEQDPKKKQELLNLAAKIYDLADALKDFIKAPNENKIEAPAKKDAADQAAATPAQADKGCIKNIVYQTKRPVILGVLVDPVSEIKPRP